MVLYGKDSITLQSRWFSHYLITKVVSNATLYGICVYVQETQLAINFPTSIPSMHHIVIAFLPSYTLTTLQSNEQHYSLQSIERY